MFALTAVGLVVAGPAFLVAAARSAADARTFASAEPCARAGTVDCLEDEPARVVDKLASTLRRGRNEYLVDVVRSGGGRHRVSLVDRADFDVLRVGYWVRLRRYHGDDVALVFGGRELRTVDHPEYAWASRLAWGFWCTSFGGFLAWALVATRGRLKPERLRRRRLGRAGPFFVLGGAAPLVADAWFEAAPRTLVAVSAVAAVVVAGGAFLTAARFDPAASPRA
jgi:hypothetical protein